jgi:adenosylcobinamide-phosphate synthase
LPATAASIAALLRHAPPGQRARLLVDAALLACVCSLRTLCARALDVANALDGGDTEAGRALLGRHLVSRDTASLAASEVAAGAIESVAENLSDGFVAPCLAFTIGGAPAAWAYRTINTLDAMWGYREPPYADLGWGAARLDDLANLAAARLTAAAICLAAAIDRRDARGAVRSWRADARRTASPNAGHPMAAMAGALGVRLAKAGQYELHPSGRDPDVDDVRAAVRLSRTAATLVLATLYAGLLFARGRR